MTLRNYSSTAAETTLSSGVDASTTTLTVSATTGFPATPFVLAIDAGAAAQELVLVTNVAGTTLTVTRAFDSTVASAHDTGAVVAHSHAAIDFREANTHVNAESGVHGATGDVVGTSDAQTLTNKTLALGSNTMSGTKAQFNAALTGDDFVMVSDSDTGWTDLAFASGWSGVAKYKKVNGVVTVIINAAKATWGTGDPIASDSLPVGYRPVALALTAGANAAVDLAFRSWQITTAGVVQAAGAGTGSIYGTCTYVAA